MPLNATCIDCGHIFSYFARLKAEQTGRCPSCQEKYEIEKSRKEIDSLIDQMESIYSDIVHLKQKKEVTETAYYQAKEEWAKSVKFYESLNWKKSTIQHKLDIRLGRKKVTKGKSRKKESKDSKKAAQIALSALNQLDEETRKLVIAQMNKS